MNKMRAPTPPDGPSGASHRKNMVVQKGLTGLGFLAMFVLGLLVGRGAAPVRFDVARLEERLAALRAALARETTERYKIAFEKMDREIDLGFHEALTADEVDLNTGALSDIPGAPTPDRTPTVSSGDKVQPGRVPKKTRGAAFGHKATAPPSTPAPVGRWTIQVAATQHQADADRVVDRLRKQDFNAYHIRAQLPDRGVWYRIRIDGYASRDAAQNDVARLTKENFAPIVIAP